MITSREFIQIKCSNIFNKGRKMGRTEDRKDRRWDKEKTGQGDNIMPHSMLCCPQPPGA